MYLDLVLVRVAVHLAHAVPDCATSTLKTCLKGLEPFAYVYMLVSLCKKDFNFCFFLRPDRFLNLCHTWLTLLLSFFPLQDL